MSTSRVAVCLFAVTAILPLAMLMAGPPKPPVLPEIAEPSPARDADRIGRLIPRTMNLCAGSTPKRRWPVKILFYGQSITAQPWWKRVAADIVERFPHAELTIKNRAIGGFGIPLLRRTAEHDVFPSYPDLIVLHAYDVARGQLANLVAEIRRRTTAEIVLWTHHVCVRKARKGQSRAAFRKKLQAHQRRRDKGSEEIRRVAAKYGCELIEVCEQWKEYLAAHNLKPETFLVDQIHLNKTGWALMAKLHSRHFRRVEGATNRWSECVDVRPVGPLKDGRIRMRFIGNRIDLITTKLPHAERPSSARVLIDGKPPSENPRLYAFTRPSRAPHSWWPAIMRVDHKTPLLVETWTLKVTGISHDFRELSFELTGSQTGPDGSGVSTKKFISNSGRVVIERRDWKVAGALKWSKKPMPADYAVTWSVRRQFVNVYRPPAELAPGQVHITTLAQGLTNGPHMLELIPQGDGPLPIEAVRVHRPPLGDERGPAR